MSIEVVCADRVSEVFEDLDRVRAELEEERKKTAALQADVDALHANADADDAHFDAMSNELADERRRLADLRAAIRAAIAHARIGSNHSDTLANIQRAVAESYGKR